MIFRIPTEDVAIEETIIGEGIAIVFQLTNEMKHQTNEFRNQAGKFTQTQTEKNTMNGFLRQTTLSHIDEKVALY